MKYLITTIAAVVLVGCGESQSPEPPDISLFDAAEEGDIEAVKQHIAAGTDINQNSFNASPALYIASLEGHYEIVKLLLANGADVNLGFSVEGRTLSPLDSSTGQGHDKISDLLRQNGGKHGDIFGAVRSEDYEAVKDFIAAGEVNKTEYRDSGDTALDKAIWNDLPKMQELLRKHGGKTLDELKAATKPSASQEQ